MLTEHKYTHTHILHGQQYEEKKTSPSACRHTLCTVGPNRFAELYVVRIEPIFYTFGGKNTENAWTKKKILCKSKIKNFEKNLAQNESANNEIFARFAVVCLLWWDWNVSHCVRGSRDIDIEPAPSLQFFFLKIFWSAFELWYLAIWCVCVCVWGFWCS